MEEILQITRDSRALSIEEKKEIQGIRGELGKEYCHRCDYCQPCPQDIPISVVLDAESLLKRMTLESLIEGMDPAIEKAKRCTECEECTERCPYGLPITGLLREKDCCLGKEKSWELETHYIRENSKRLTAVSLRKRHF